MAEFRDNFGHHIKPYCIFTFFQVCYNLEDGLVDIAKFRDNFSHHIKPY